MFDEILNQLITLSVVLGFYVLAWAGRQLAGVKRVRKQHKQWNWAQFRDGLFDRFCMVVGYALLVVGCNILLWLFPKLGITLSEETLAVLRPAVLLAPPAIAGAVELVMGIKSIRQTWGWTKNLKYLQMVESDINPDDADVAGIADDVKEAVSALYSSINTRHESPDAIAGEVLTKAQTKKLAEMGSIPYYKLDVSTPQLAYQNLLGKGFNEGWGLQCVAGFKEFMFSLAGRYVAAGGAAAKYASEPARSVVCKLGFTWHDGADGLQDGDWGIWTSGEFGHVAMYYQGKWLGQNQAAADGNIGNAFNLIGLPMQGFAGYFRPNIYKNIEQPTDNPATIKPAPVEPTSSNFKIGDKVFLKKYVDVNGIKLANIQSTPYTVFQVRESDKTAVLKSDDDDIYARVTYANIRKAG